MKPIARSIAIRLMLKNTKNRDARPLSKILLQRITIIGAVLSVSAVSLTALIITLLNQSFLEEEVVARIDQYQTVLAFSVQENDYDAVENTSYLVTNDHDVIYFDIINRFGRVIAQYGDVPVKEDNWQLLEYDILDPTFPEVIIARSKYYVHSPKLGHDEILTALIGGLVASLISILLCLWLYREIKNSFVKPLIALHEAVPEIGSKEQNSNSFEGPLEVQELGEAVAEAIRRAKLANEANLRRVDILTQVLQNFQFAVRHINKNGEIVDYGVIDCRMIPSEFPEGVALNGTALSTKLRVFSKGLKHEVKNILDSDHESKELLYHAAHKISENEIYEILLFALDDGDFAVAQINVTRRRKLERTVNEAQKQDMIAQLSRGMAHDFNNLLGVITSNAELLELLNKEPENQPHIKAILDSTNRGKHLTQSLLSFARQSTLTPKIVNLNILVKDVLQWAAKVIPENINTQLVLHKGLWPVEVDPNLMENAILNLILNARDSMQKGGHLTIETANYTISKEHISRMSENLKPGQYSVLSVTDTGAGISAKTQKKIFDPFFTTKGPDKGTGVGLSMVQGFVRQSGGMIRVYSEVGVGTTFNLYFPKTSREIDENIADQRQDTDLVIPQMNILLVEDDPSLLNAMNQILNIEGHHVTLACQGEEALNIFFANPEKFDLIITDIVMPGSLTGVALVHKIRAKFPNLPAIFTSGYALEATVHGNGLRHEDIRLMKPVSRQELNDALKQVSDLIALNSKT